MQKKEVWLEIFQTANYEQSDTPDTWQHQCTAELLELNTFSKLTYINQEHQRVEMKWWWDNASHQWQASVKKGQGILCFNPNEPTKSLYQTAHGTWEMTVTTQRIHQQWQKDGKRKYFTLIIEYQLSVDNQKIGTYLLKTRHNI